MFNFKYVGFIVSLISVHWQFLFICFSDTVFTMNCDKVVKHEEDPLPRTEIKTEPQLNYKFFILCFVLFLHKTVDWYIETYFNYCFTERRLWNKDWSRGMGSYLC